MALIVCPDCGAQVSDAAVNCPHCGRPIAKPQIQPTQNVNLTMNQTRVCPETHLAKAIIVTILCCWPFGIPAIVNASGVSSAFAAGNYELALQKSRDADKWGNVSIICAIVFWLLYILFYVVIFTGTLAL